MENPRMKRTVNFVEIMVRQIKNNMIVYQVSDQNKWPNHWNEKMNFYRDLYRAWSPHAMCKWQFNDRQPDQLFKYTSRFSNSMFQHIRRVLWFLEKGRSQRIVICMGGENREFERWKTRNEEKMKELIFWQMIEGEGENWRKNVNSWIGTNVPEACRADRMIDEKYQPSMERQTFLSKLRTSAPK